jgi:hypothetical protein
MEDITLAKEAAMKQRGAEIITAFPEDFSSSSSTAAEAGAAGGTAAEGSGTAAGTADEVDENGRWALLFLRQGLLQEVQQ